MKEESRFGFRVSLRGILWNNFKRDDVSIQGRNFQELSKRLSQTYLQESYTVPIGDGGNDTLCEKETGTQKGGKIFKSKYIAIAMK